MLQLWHLLGTSQLCRAKLLRGGPWIDQDVAAVLQIGAAAECLGAIHGGKHKNYHELPVVRMLGPYVQVAD